MASDQRIAETVGISGEQTVPAPSACVVEAVRCNGDLIVGYLGSKIEEYFGDGSRFGLHIEYANEETPLGTGGALRDAEKMLQTDFLLYLLVDRFWSFGGILSATAVLEFSCGLRESSRKNSQ